jgi:hypothetical protein
VGNVKAANKVSGPADGLRVTFMRTLIEDVISATHTLDVGDNQLNRRHLIRVLFAAIEGLVWTYREDILGIAKSTDTLTAKEEYAFSEVTYQVTPQGKITEQARFVPILGMFRLTTRLAQRIDTTLEVRFDDAGWNALKLATDIRNRITHPKTEADLQISDIDLKTCRAGFDWLFEVCISATMAATAAFRSYLKTFDAVLEALRSGDPETWAEYKAAAIALKD